MNSEIKKTGNYLGVDVSTFGDYKLEKNKITGTLNKVEQFEQFSNSVSEQSGYYICLNLEPWQEIKFGFDNVIESTAKACKDDGIIIGRVCGTDKLNPHKKFKAFRNGGVTVFDISELKLQ